MKEIKITKTIEEVISYEANDGTRFSSREECEKYENTAKAVLYDRVQKYKVAVTTEYEFFCYRGCDENAVEIYTISDDSAFNDICMYAKSYEEPKISGEISLPDKANYVGKTMIIIWNYDHDYCWFYTIESALDEIRHNYDVLINAKQMEV